MKFYSTVITSRKLKIEICKNAMFVRSRKIQTCKNKKETKDNQNLQNCK